MIDQVWWFATRGAGLLTWACATATVLIGLLMSSRLVGRRPGRPWLLDLHRFTSLLTWGFLAIHLVTLWLDGYVEFGPRELFIPFTSSWRPGAVAWGIASMYVLAVVEVTSRLKRFLPDHVWHTIHLGSYGALVAGTVHGWRAGSDVGNPIVASVAAAALLAVIVLTAVRTGVAPGRPTATPVDRAAMLHQARERARTPVMATATPSTRLREALARRP